MTMILQQPSLDQLEKDRVILRRGLELLHATDLDIGDASSRGRRERRRDEMIEQYRSMLGSLDQAITDFHRENPGSGGRTDLA